MSPPPKKNKNTATEEEKLEEVEDTGRDAKSQHTVLAYSPRKKQQPYIYLTTALALSSFWGPDFCAQTQDNPISMYGNKHE